MADDELIIPIDDILDGLPDDDFVRKLVEAQVAVFHAQEHPDGARYATELKAAMKPLLSVMGREITMRRDMAKDEFVRAWVGDDDLQLGPSA